VFLKHFNVCKSTCGNIHSLEPAASKHRVFDAAGRTNMTIRTLAVTLVIATGIAATSAVLAYSSSAPAAVRTNEGFAGQTINPTDTDAMLRKNGAAEFCRDAIWPNLPAACIRNAEPERLSRPIRIIPIHALLPRQ
jgi:hypothetical protein